MSPQSTRLGNTIACLSCDPLILERYQTFRAAPLHSITDQPAQACVRTAIEARTQVLGIVSFASNSHNEPVRSHLITFGCHEWKLEAVRVCSMMVLFFGVVCLDVRRQGCVMAMEVECTAFRRQPQTTCAITNPSLSHKYFDLRVQSAEPETKSGLNSIHILAESTQRKGHQSREKTRLRQFTLHVECRKGAGRFTS